MENQKEIFLPKTLALKLKKLQAEAKGKWGIMDAQQMVEHMVDAVRCANGKLVLPLINKGEKLQKSREFLMSDKPFKENINNPFIPEAGFPHRKADIKTGINKLQKELDYFFEVFSKHPEMKTVNPFFGELDFTLNVQLLYKHALHHLTQFGIT